MPLAQHLGKMQSKIRTFRLNRSNWLIYTMQVVHPISRMNSRSIQSKKIKEPQ
jgi:hypothetical protein